MQNQEFDEVDNSIMLMYDRSLLMLLMANFANLTSNPKMFVDSVIDSITDIMIDSIKNQPGPTSELDVFSVLAGNYKDDYIKKVHDISKIYRDSIIEQMNLNNNHKKKK